MIVFRVVVEYEIFAHSRTNFIGQQALAKMANPNQRPKIETTHSRPSIPLSQNQDPASPGPTRNPTKAISRPSPPIPHSVASSEPVFAASLPFALPDNRHFSRRSTQLPGQKSFPSTSRDSQCPAPIEEVGRNRDIRGRVGGTSYNAVPFDRILGGYVDSCDKASIRTLDAVW